MNTNFTEANYENAIIELLSEQMGYTHLYGPDVEREYSQPLHLDLVRSSLQDINQGKPAEAVEEAIVRITTFEGGALVQKNEIDRKSVV